MSRHQRQEREANQFAIGLLAPPYLVDPFLARDPDLRAALQMTTRLDISFEAALWCYVERCEEPLAAVWSQAGSIRYAVRGRGFPWISRCSGSQIVATTAASRAIRSGRTGVTRISETPALAWLDRAEIELFEQTRVGGNGHAVTLLWASMPGADGADDDGIEELGTPGFRKR